jgi:hypothetical protein
MHEQDKDKSNRQISLPINKYSLTLRLKLSQYAAQSLTRRNCATSNTFHSAGISSPGSPTLPVASTSLGISFPLAAVDWKSLR